YAGQNNIDAEGDQLFPVIAMSGELGFGIAVFFILGLVAAAYSSADSALTSLTTSFSIDILEIEKKHSGEKQIKIRKRVHILMSFVLLFCILILRYLIRADDSVIEKIFIFAGYTYGPLLGLYAFGLFSKWKVKDKFVPFVAILAPVLSYFISVYSLKWYAFEW